MGERAIVPGYGGKYTVDTYGNVYNGDKMLKTMTHNNNPNCVSLYNGSKPKIVTIARIMALAFLKGTPNDFVCYRDGDYTNLHLSNLYLGSRSEASKALFNFRKANRLFTEDKRVKEFVLGDKPILCLDPKTREVVGSYNNVSEAARDVDVSEQAIMRACMGKVATCCHRIWCFDSEYNVEGE